jgi:hypothetical protein
VTSKPRLAAVISVLLVTAACGLNTDEQTAAHNLRDAFVVDKTTNRVVAEADCLTAKWVGEVGVDALVRDGLLTKKLKADQGKVDSLQSGQLTVSAGTATGYARAAVACEDFDVVAQDLKKSHPKATDDQIDDYADCLKDIPVGTLRQSFVDRVTGKPNSKASRTVAASTLDCADIIS